MVLLPLLSCRLHQSALTSQEWPQAAVVVVEGVPTVEDLLDIMVVLVITLTEHHHPCTEPPCMEGVEEDFVAEEGRVSFGMYHGSSYGGRTLILIICMLFMSVVVAVEAVEDTMLPTKYYMEQAR